VKITQDVREYAKEQNVEAEKVLAFGMEENELPSALADGQYLK
jgi:hypothetical protein